MNEKEMIRLLLVPRAVVAVPWPLYPAGAGYQFQSSGQNFIIPRAHALITDDPLEEGVNCDLLPLAEALRCSANIRVLPWYEGREENQLPPYVKAVTDGGETKWVHKVESWLPGSVNTNAIPVYQYRRSTGGLHRASLRDMLPAAEAEYRYYEASRPAPAV